MSFANGQVSGERPRVDFERLAGFPVLLPPVDEQKRIATKLSVALSGMERAKIAARRARERLYKMTVLLSFTMLLRENSPALGGHHNGRTKGQALKLTKLYCKKNTFCATRTLGGITAGALALHWPGKLR